MTAKFTADEILYVTHGRIARGSAGNRKGRLVWDLDEIRTDDWFVAMPSGQEDSHDLLSAALSRGAQGCLVNRRQRYCFSPPDGTLISVADTEIALLELAGYWRNTAAEKVVTVTGTIGRKETINYLELLLRRMYRCHIAIEDGALRCLPDLLSMPAGTELLIAEVSGVNRGDIARVGNYLRPDLAVITNTQHPIPSEAREARLAALNCEILETINELGNGTAIVYDRNPALRERSKLLLKGLRSVYFSESSSSPAKSRLTWLTRNGAVALNETKVQANAWCALTAAVCLGFSPTKNPHIVSEILVDAG